MFLGLRGWCGETGPLLIAAELVAFAMHTRSMDLAAIVYGTTLQPGLTVQDYFVTAGICSRSVYRGQKT